MNDLTQERVCIHQVTLMQCDFQQSIECLARNGVYQTALWIDKLEEIGAVNAAKVLDDNGVSAVSICAGGSLSGRSVQQQKQAQDNNKRWLEHAATIGAPSMVTLTGGLDVGDTDIAGARDQAIEGLAALIPVAKSMGVKLALEPLHPMVCGFRSVISTLAEANDILDTLNDEIMGIALDSYALWWDPALAQEIQRAGSRIINFHVADWLSETRDIRLDRGMPGDGHINNREIRNWLETTGFNGPVEVEVFSKLDWWTREPDEVVKTVLSRSMQHL